MRRAGPLSGLALCLALAAVPAASFALRPRRRTDAVVNVLARGDNEAR